MTNEFKHFEGCEDFPEDCSGCALTKPTMIDYGGGVEKLGINYAAWPLSYIQNNKTIPDEFMGFLKEELETDNRGYLINLIKHLLDAGYDVQAIYKGARQ